MREQTVHDIPAELREPVELLRQRLAGDNAAWSALCKVMRALAAQCGGSVGRLTIEHFRGVRGMENVDFEYTGQLEPGTYHVYTAPPSQPVAVPDGAMVERLALWLRSNARMLMLATGDTTDWHRDYARDILAAAFVAAPEVPRG